MKDDSWMNNPALNQIDPQKLKLLSSLAGQAANKNQNELLSFLMAAGNQAQSTGMTFNSAEIEAIISVMKIGKSPKEVKRIDKLCALMKQFEKNQA